MASMKCLWASTLRPEQGGRNPDLLNHTHDSLSAPSKHALPAFEDWWILLVSKRLLC